LNDLLAAQLPELMRHLPGFQLYCFCFIILLLKVMFVSTLTGRVRLRVKVSLNPEDAAIGTQAADTEHPEVARVQRAHRNDVENIPLFLLLGLLATLAGVPLLGLRILFITFTLARLVHTITYLRGLQPWRTLSFALGQVSCGVLLVLLFIRIL